MILFGGKKKDKFSGDEFIKLVQAGKYDEALNNIGEVDLRHVGDEPDFLFTYQALHYLKKDECYEFDYSADKLKSLEKEWALSGDIEKVLGLYLYNYYILKDKSYVNKLIDSFELIGDYNRAVEFFKSEIGVPKDAAGNNKLGFLLWELKDYKRRFRCSKSLLL